MAIPGEKQSTPRPRANVHPRQKHGNRGNWPKWATSGGGLPWDTSIAWCDIRFGGVTGNRVKRVIRRGWRHLETSWQDAGRRECDRDLKQRIW